MESHNLMLELPVTSRVPASANSTRFKESKSAMSFSHCRISSGGGRLGKGCLREDEKQQCYIGCKGSGIQSDHKKSIPSFGFYNNDTIGTTRTVHGSHSILNYIDGFDIAGI